MGQSDVLDAPFVLPCSNAQWLEASPAIFKKEKRWWSLFIPQGPFSVISEAIVNIISTGKSSQNLLSSIQVTNDAFGTSSAWDLVLKAIEDRLNPANNAPPRESVILFQLLAYFISAGLEKATQTTQRVVDGGHLMHALSSAHKANDIEAKASFITIALKHHPNAAKQITLGESENGHAVLASSLGSDEETLAKLITDSLATDNGLSLLFDVIDARKAYDPLVVRCLKILADSENPTELFTPEECIKRWELLKTYINDGQKPNRLSDLIGYLCVHSNFASAVQSRDGGFKYEDTGLYLLVARKDSAASFVGWCVAGLQGLQKEIWLKELEKTGDALELVTLLVELNKDISLRVAYQDALRDYAQNNIAGNIRISQDLLKRRLAIFQAMAGSTRAVLRELVRDLAMEQNGRLPDGFFELFGDELADHATLTENDDIIIRLFSPLVEQRSSAGLNWLNQVFNERPKLLSEYDNKQKVENFRDRLQSETEKTPSKDDPVQQLLLQIWAAVGFKE